MTTYALPQIETFTDADNGKMGSVNGDYSASATVTYPTGTGDYITGGKALKSVHVGSQSLKALLQFSSAQAELFMGFALKAQIVAIGDGSDEFSLITIKNGANVVLSLVPNVRSVNGPPTMRVKTRLELFTQTDEIGMALFDNQFHYYLMHWKYGAGDGESGLWVDGKQIVNMTGLTMDVDDVTADRAGIEIASVDAGNNFTYTFDQFEFRTTEPTPGDRANIVRIARMIHV